MLGLVKIGAFMHVVDQFAYSLHVYLSLWLLDCYLVIVSL
jgi:hypothetical protein